MKQCPHCGKGVPDYAKRCKYCDNPLPDVPADPDVHLAQSFNYDTQRGRPFQVITHNGFVEALLKQITDPTVQKIAQQPLIGSLDLFSDNTALLSHSDWRERVLGLYE